MLTEPKMTIDNTTNNKEESPELLAEPDTKGDVTANSTPPTAGWKELAPMKRRVVSYNGVAVNDHQFLVVGGRDFDKDGDLFSFTNDCEYYDSRTKVWTKLAIQTPGKPRAGFGLVVVKTRRRTRIYMVGGQDREPYNIVGPARSALHVLEIPDGDLSNLVNNPGQWETLASMEDVRVDHACVAHKNSIYVFGGKQRDWDKAVDTIEVYNIRTNQWTTLPERIPTGGRTHVRAAAIGDKIYVNGGALRFGVGGIGVRNDTLVFDTASGKFEPEGTIPDMNIGRCNHQLVVVNDRYLVVVEDSRWSRNFSMEAYDVVSRDKKSWTFVQPSHEYKRFEFTAGFLKETNTMILAAGEDEIPGQPRRVPAVTLEFDSPLFRSNSPEVLKERVTKGEVQPTFSTPPTEFPGWKELAPMKRRILHPDGCVAVNDHQFLVLGGRDLDNGGEDYTFTNACEYYDSRTKEWTKLAIKTPMGLPRRNYGLVTVGTRVYIVGGQLRRPFNGGGELRSDVVSLDIPGGDLSNLVDDPAQGWESHASMRHARDKFACVAHNNSIYVIGGNTNDDVMDTIERYDIETDEWTTLPERIPTGLRNDLVGGVVGDKIYVNGGVNPGLQKDTLVFDIASGKFEPEGTIPDMHVERSSHQMTVVGDRYLVVISDSMRNGTFNIEAYDVVNRNKAWTFAQPPTDYLRQEFAFGFLKESNTMILAGGVDVAHGVWREPAPVLEFDSPLFRSN